MSLSSPDEKQLKETLMRKYVSYPICLLVKHTVQFLPISSQIIINDATLGRCGVCYISENKIFKAVLCCCIHKR